MEQPQKSSELTQNRFLIATFVGPALVFAGQAIGWVFNDKTELTPDHSSLLSACFTAGALAALACIIFVTGRYPKPTLLARFGISLPYALMAFIVVYMVSYEVLGIVANRVDFPPAKTHTCQAYIWIWRAYQTHGKGRSWNIQTTPIWSNMSITENDYNFMLAHRRPGDQTSDPDEISSKGYLCAKVMMQQAGRAVRVLHAGDRKLPEGTVVLCPADGRNIFQGVPSVLDADSQGAVSR